MVRIWVAESSSIVASDKAGLEEASETAVGRVTRNNMWQERWRKSFSSNRSR